MLFGVKPRVYVRADDLNLPYRQCEYEILAPVLRAECDRKRPRPIGIREAVKFKSTGDQDAKTAQIARWRFPRAADLPAVLARTPAKVHPFAARFGAFRRARA
jgi:hypothetical protein